MSTIIKRQHVTRESTGTVVKHAEKNIRVIQNNGEVFAIELTCSCGEVSVIELLQSDQNPGQPAPNTPS